jgi:2-oxoisovalerate dehydrogenase E1 component
MSAAPAPADEAGATGGLTVDDGLRMLRAMLEIRLFETEVQSLFLADLVRGSTHLCQGQEAAAVGACHALRPGDAMTCTYRGHGAVLAMGAPLDRSFAEILGRREGLCGGKGGSMHLTDVSVGAFGSFAIVGCHLPIANGLALAAVYRGSGAVSLCFFGDGSTNIGGFHESLNLASVMGLPVIFVCENNLYGEYSPLTATTAVAEIATRASAYGMPGRRVDGNDVSAVRDAVGEAARRARRSRPHADRGPHLPTGRSLAQRSGDLPAAGRTRRVAGARPDPAAHPPAVGHRDRRGAARPRAHRGRVRGRRGAGAGEGVAGTRTAIPLGERLGMSPLTYRQAIADALADELAADEDVLLLGEDIAAAGGVFKVTDGLLQRFGARRVIDTPISEQAIIGAAIGASLLGLRPVAELMFADFAGVCFDQIANQLAKYRYMTDGQVTTPVTIRLVNGAGIGFGAQHSQAVENWFLNVAGLKIAVPGTPADAYGLLRAAIRDPNPVLFFEHKALYGRTGPGPGEHECLPFGEAEVVRRGRDVTLVATQMMRFHALAAADALAQRGVSAEVVDLRTLVPLDAETVGRSVEETHHLVVVEEASPFGSWGGQLIATIAQERFESLDGPPALVSGDPAPIPFAAELEAAWLPSPQRIVSAVLATLGQE